MLQFSSEFLYEYFLTSFVIVAFISYSCINFAHACMMQKLNVIKNQTNTINMQIDGKDGKANGWADE